MKTYTIGIDIGGTNFRIGMVSDSREISDFQRKSSSIFSEGDVIETLYKEITAYLEHAGKDKDVRAVAIGLPSIVSRDKKTIYSTPNLKGFDHIEFGDTLSEKLGMPVFLDRDVNFLLQNDISMLGLETDKTIVGFYVGTGFGNAIYLNGSFYCGKNGAAGELGHIPLYDVTDECTCGNHGCSEVRCSGKYLEKLAATYFPNTRISEIFAKHDEDPKVIKFVEDLAIPIATEINILDPDYIVLAGGVLYMENFPKDILIRSIHRYTRKPYPERNLDIRFSEHTQESGVYGSGDFAHKAIKNINL